MAKTLRNAWRIPEVRKKLLYMVLLIVIFRVGAYIPIPGISPKYVGDLLNAENNYITNYFNLMSGGSFGNFTVMALGISPYINSSIIMQLLSIALPPLERLQKEGEMGRKKVERITRYLGVLFAIVMAIGVVFGMDVGATVVNSVIPQVLSNITIIIVLTAGTTFLMWLSELITEIGIGNGSSMIIFVGIIAKLPGTIRMLFDSAFGWNQTPDAARMPVWMLPLIAVGTIFIIAAVTFIDLGERRVPVQYSKRMVGRKMYGGQSSFIPVRVNANGVMPLIFAMTLVNFPQIIITFAPNSGFATWWTAWMGPGSAVYFIVFALLIILFSYFYTMITFNPIELSKNMQAQGAFIPGIRPGRSTSDYLSKISGRLTLVSAIFLALIATLPTLLSKFIPGAQVFGATSLLIMVSVALETNKQLDAQISMRQYKGFLK